MDSRVRGNDRPGAGMTVEDAGISKVLEMDEKIYCVYMMTNKRDGTLYIGVTNNLVRRVYEHRNGLIEGFSKKYNLHRLVYYERHNDPTTAIRREKQMKKWLRCWKVELIEEKNPEWNDVYNEIL